MEKLYANFSMKINALWDAGEVKTLSLKSSLGMRILTLTFLCLFAFGAKAQSDLIITGIIDGPRTGGLPKAFELYVVSDIPNLGIYGVRAANNGTTTPGSTYNLSGSATAGSYLYVATEIPGFTAFFGFAPTFTSNVANFNGDDVIQLLQSGNVVDVFGVLGVDGTGEPWEYLDGWGYRKNGTGPDGETFNLDNWNFSGPDALDGLGTGGVNGGPNAFPIGSYQPGTGGGTPVVSITATDATATEQGTTTGTFRISRTGTTTASLTVNYTIGGSATNGTDYTPALTGTVTIAAAASFADITITPVDDSDDEGEETATLTLTDAAEYDLGTNTAASIAIADNDAPIVVIKIHTIQGSGPASPLEGQTITISGIVTATYPALDAIFVQEEDADTDADPNTSEGIFVFLGTDPTVSIGDKVQVTGAVDEFFGMTQLDNDNSNLSVSLISSNQPLPTPISISLPIPSAVDVNAFYEKYEAMLVTFTNKLVVSEYFQLGRFGETVLSADSRPFIYSHVDNTPTVAENLAYTLDLSRRQIILDDDNNLQNGTFGGKIFYPQPAGFGIGTQGTNYFRGGDAINNLTGVLHWSFGGNAASPDAWRVRPVTGYPVQFSVENPRPATPAALGGNIKVASFNVLNYFTTLNQRGANTNAELVRQTDKLVQAVLGTNADVIGIMEVENNGGTAMTAMVNALNNVAGAGTYAFINTGVVGTDQITCAIIYKPAVVTPQGAVAILSDASFTDPNNIGSMQNRPAIASTFQVTGAGNADLGARFTVVVNHLKAKGSSGPGLDNDQMDGQSAYNSTRTKGAQALAQWLTTDPTGSGDPDFLIIGDLNSYKGEDPITALKNLGYAELIEQFSGNNAYGYVFDGQTGYLDHALSNSTLTAQVTGVTEWHINADEVNLFDYNTENKPAGASLYEVNAFRTSDHDPVIIGLDLTPLHTWYRDKDGDGYGSGSRTIIATTKPKGYVSNPYDCNDSNADVHSGAPELEDGIDNDCDGEVDEDLACRKLWYKDADGDEVGRSTVTRYSCVPLGAEWVLIGGDCKDNDPDVYPGAPEICDGKNNDCNSETREDCSILITSAKPANAVNLKAATSINESALEATIWPNPTRTELMVNLDAFVPNQKLSITMMQADGKVQQSQSLTPSVKGQQVRLDVSSAAAGFYLFQIKQGLETQTKRVVIIR